MKNLFQGIKIGSNNTKKSTYVHWLTCYEFIAVKKIFAVKIHRSEIGKFTAFMSTRKRGFFRRKTLAKPFISVVFWHF